MNAEGLGTCCGAHAVGAEKGTGDAGGAKSLLLIIGSDVLGKEETIGKVLMKGFFETMKVNKQVQHTIFDGGLAIAVGRWPVSSRYRTIQNE
ncbi:MAG: hypothetical protein HGB21_14285 [Nitrospirae bacterium]|nr:hypothetical protein [Nitrospirota bacterium]